MKKLFDDALRKAFKSLAKEMGEETMNETTKSDSLEAVIQEAERYGFSGEEQAMVKEIYENACQHYYQRVYKPQTEQMKYYAASHCRHYIMEKIDNWHKDNEQLELWGKTNEQRKRIL